LLRQESHQRSGLRGGADREACRASGVIGTLLPRLQAALPLRILSRPPSGLGWWSDFLGFLPSADFFCSAKRTNRRGGAVRRPGLPSFSDLRAARRTAPTGAFVNLHRRGGAARRPGLRFFSHLRAARRTAPTGAFVNLHRRGGAVRRPGLPSFSDLRAARRTAPTGAFFESHRRGGY